MAATKLLLLFVLLQTILLFSYHVKADEKDDLLNGINSYRSSLNLSALNENNNADCLADKIADQFKNQPCTKTTGANTVPGTENQFSNFPDLLGKCHLNLTNTVDGTIMPACVPNLVPSVVLTNFTESQYSGNLNKPKYTGIGIGSEGDWIVVVLSTSNTNGSFVPAANTASIASHVPKFSLIYLLSLFLGFFSVYYLN
ncbi:hypothetical protein IFM89_017497 [Coptis chinensis]|uniref:Uncharacterized GPI-anchored protein At5g19230-like domain-containing protein n=1 Tax=Coptis chinensis TaxID=261450 RepID=A0A835HW74_9MAGN|nr:hypothetical protein IFM89_017497 [Coptis chinensis]